MEELGNGKLETELFGGFGGNFCLDVLDFPREVMTHKSRQAFHQARFDALVAAFG